jgi:hypothetical protein
MIAISSRTGDSLTIDSRRQLQFMAPAFVDMGDRLRVLIRAVSCNLERRLATFADVPCHEPLSRQQWEHLWETGSWLS